MSEILSALDIIRLHAFAVSLGSSQLRETDRAPYTFRFIDALTRFTGERRQQLCDEIDDAVDDFVRAQWSKRQWKPRGDESDRETCPECLSAASVEPTVPSELTSDQSGYRSLCIRCCFVFGHPEDDS